MKRITTDRIAKTVLAGCHKFGAATLLRTGGATMSKVTEIYEDENGIRDSADTRQDRKGHQEDTEAVHDVSAHQCGLRPGEYAGTDSRGI